MVCILKHLKVGAVLHPLWAMRSCAIKFGFQPLRRGGIAEELTAGYSFLGGSMEGLGKKLLRQLWHRISQRKEAAMEIFGETFRVVGVESQRLILRGLRSGDMLTIMNADPETPLTEEDYPLGEVISLTDLSNEAQH
ncbi:MAG TPA: hypothetical protein VFQ43_02005 [Nitrososphaera sp.]|nr:hypothetical protein [Nitrososphaera sp.]